MTEAQRADAAASLQMGVYRHYEGKHYLLIGLAHDANADRLHAGVVRTRHVEGEQPDMTYAEIDMKPLGERWVVVYVPLEGTTGPGMSVRTLEDFVAWVHADERNGCRQPVGTTCTDGAHEWGRHVQQRFTYLGPTWEIS